MMKFLACAIAIFLGLVFHAAADTTMGTTRGYPPRTLPIEMSTFPTRPAETTRLITRPFPPTEGTTARPEALPTEASTYPTRTRPAETTHMTRPLPTTVAATTKYVCPTAHVCHCRSDAHVVNVQDEYGCQSCYCAHNPTSAGSTTLAVTRPLPTSTAAARSGPAGTCAPVVDCECSDTTYRRFFQDANSCWQCVCEGGETTTAPSTAAPTRTVYTTTTVPETRAPFTTSPLSDTSAPVYTTSPYVTRTTTALATTYPCPTVEPCRWNPMMKQPRNYPPHPWQHCFQHMCIASSYWNPCSIAEK